MSVYRVLVAHRGLRVGQIVETDNPVTGYMKEVPDARPEPDNLVTADPAPDLPVRRRAANKTKVSNVEDRTEPGSGPEDSES